MATADTIAAIATAPGRGAIGLLRISGPIALEVATSIAGSLPPPRQAGLRTFRDRNGEAIDQGLVLVFPAPRSYTGEHLVELQGHGGVVLLQLLLEAAIAAGARMARPGEFSERAFLNGRLDLAQAEAVGDLIDAASRQAVVAAQRSLEGAFSERVTALADELMGLRAWVEGALDFSDEEDAADLPESFTWNMRALAEEIAAWLARPRSERLGEGFRVVLAGPPNVGKSTLFNALIESEAAITSPIAGTTRDVIERSVAIGGVPFTFVDTAGLRVVEGAAEADQIESIGIARAEAELARADLVLWLGPEGAGPEAAWEVAAQADRAGFVAKNAARFIVSAATGEGLAALKNALVEAARVALPKPGDATLNARQHARLSEAEEALAGAQRVADPLLVAEELRRARLAFDRLIGRATTEDMLDTLFGRFCIGK